MKNFNGIVAWYSTDRIPGILSCTSNISISLIFNLNSKIALVFELNCEWRIIGELLWGFVSMLCFDLLAILIVKCNDSASFSFLFLFFFPFVKDQIASFQLKQIIVFLN